MTARSIVYLDTETTGLDPDVHEVVEVAWAHDLSRFGGSSWPVGMDKVRTLVLPHEFRSPDPVALKLNGYLDRELHDPARWCTSDDVRGLWATLRGCTLAGFNPAFDALRLTKVFDKHGLTPVDPWHYRLLDVAAYAAGVLGLDHVPGLKEVADRLTDLGDELPPPPDHTAAADVLATRAIHQSLRAIRSCIPPVPGAVPA